MTPLLELREVTKVFGGSFFRRESGTLALDDVSLAVETDSPSITAIAGESGSGKSTLGLLLLGFHEPTRGQVLYNGKDLRQLSGREMRQFRQDVQAVFQDPFAVYNPFYKVDHIMHVPIRKFKLARSKQEARNLIEQVLERVGLRPDETLGRYPHQLSGGQRQRLVVARALLMQPKLIIADEPVSMVDASLRATILENLRQLRDDFDISILYITHDLTTAYHISDHIVILYSGSVMEAGDVESVIKDPQHPYTQLLVNSIPWPDLNRKWGGDQVVVKEAKMAEGEAVNRGCKFAGRCPFVMPECRESPPPLYQANGTRVASCFLYKDSAVLDKRELGKVFKNERVPEATNLQISSG